MIRALLLFLALTAPARAGDAYPSHPVRLVVPFAPGGGTDALARILSDAAGRRLGQPIVVENIGGAGGSIGVTQVARADPDGYTVLTATPAIGINPYIQKDATYDAIRDFEPVIQATTSPIVLVVPPDSPIRTVRDLIQATGQIRYGSAGIGSIAHVSAALFAAMTGIRMTHVPYRGSGPALIDVMAGRLSIEFDNAPAVLPQIRSGQLRAVGVGSAAPSALLPDVPPVAETVPGFESASWFGILAPAKTPRPVIDRLNAALNDSLADPDTRKALLAVGAEPVGGTPEAFSAYLRARIATMKDTAREANLIPR